MRRSRATPRSRCSRACRVRSAPRLRFNATWRTDPARSEFALGMATGELVPLNGDVHGPTLNRAARVRDLARAGEVLLSASTAEVVRAAPPPGVDVLALGSHALRGLDGVDEIAAVVAEGVSTPPDPARSPYPGLASFAPEDSDLFFGREETIGRCLELFEKERFVAVVGASGSGKSSLVLAGLAPRLTEFIVVRPGVDPRRSLDAEDLPGHGGAALIVDQLEELVTLGHDPSEQAAFVDAIVAHPGGLIVAVRADLYGEFGVFDQLADRLASSQVLLGPLGEPDLLRAVHEPARRCGLAVEDGLAEVIAADLEAAPGALPLLGHALREAWLRREGRTITLAGYRASGGVRTAIAATAEQALAELDDEGQAVARRVLLRMVELRLDGDDARRWASHREISEIDPDRAPDVVATLAGARLLVVDRDQTTVVHEALLRAWPRLSGWIVEQRADLLARQEVRWAAERWVAGWSQRRRPLPREPSRRRPRPHCPRAVARSRGGVRRSGASAARSGTGRCVTPRSRRLRVLAAVTSVLAVIAARGRRDRRPAAQRRAGRADRRGRIGDDRRRPSRRCRGTGGAGVRPRPSACGRGAAPLGQRRDSRQRPQHDRAQPPGARSHPQRPAPTCRRGQRAGRSPGDGVRRQPRRGHVVRHVHSAGRGEPRRSGDELPGRGLQPGWRRRRRVVAPDGVPRVRRMRRCRRRGVRRS